MRSTLRDIQAGQYDVQIVGDAPLHVMHFGPITVTREPQRVRLTSGGAALVRAAASNLHAVRHDGRRWQLKASGKAEGACAYADFVSVCPVSLPTDDSAPATADTTSSGGDAGTPSTEAPAEFVVDASPSAPVDLDDSMRAPGRRRSTRKSKDD